MYTKEDLAQFKQRGIKAEAIDSQLANFEKGFDYVNLSEAATIGNGIIQVQPEEEERLVDTYDKACEKLDILKMVPASGSATRMFKDLYAFMDNYHGTTEEFLDLVQHKEPGTIHYFFEKMDGELFQKLRGF